jgi:hypothetical protein
MDSLFFIIGSGVAVYLIGVLVLFPIYALTELRRHSREIGELRELSGVAGVDRPYGSPSAAFRDFRRTDAVSPGSAVQSFRAAPGTTAVPGTSVSAACPTGGPDVHSL